MGKYSDMINDVKLTSFVDNDFEESQRIYGSIDPRKDKAVDHQYWEDILWNAWHFKKPLYYVLHGIRGGGGELTLTKGSYRLVPGEWATVEWENIRRDRLDPVKNDLIWILKLTQFGKVTEETLPAGMFGEIEQGRMFG